MSDVSPERVSIYIPVHNAARTLGAAIDSVLAQSVAPAEFFLVVSMRSDDESVDIARRSGVRVVEQREGRLGYGRNLALTNCRTEWLASCDADVVLDRHWLERLLERCDDNVAAVGGATHEMPITPADRFRSVNMPHNWGPLPFDNPFMLVSEMMVRVEALRGVGGYLSDLRYFEDSDACQRLRHSGHTLRYEPSAIAYHDRRDSVADVLNLRWAYAYHRQRTRLENLPGLISKLAVNRNYAIQSLSQTLHSEQADTCAISVLLWFHHARADLRSALDRWPLLSAGERAACEAALNGVLHERLGGPWADFDQVITRLLGAAASPSSATSTGLGATPGFRKYLDAVGRATGELLAEIADEIAEAVVTSGRVLARVTPPDGFAAPALALEPGDDRRLAEQTLAPAWDWSELCDELVRALGSDALNAPQRGLGVVLDDEMPDGGFVGACNGRAGIVFVPHLETSTRPLETIRAALDGAAGAVVSYRAPTSFVPAVPILSARDLAASAAGAGFAIRHFHTEAGRTRLTLCRAGRTRKGAGPAGVEAGHAPVTTAG